MWKIQIIILLHINILWTYYQSDDNFIQNLKLSVNDSIFYPDSAFTNKILHMVSRNKINYTISAMAFSDHIAHTKIKIPQTFDRDDVISQCVLYFYLLDNESDRKREYLEIYPFFEPLNSRPWIIVKYEDMDVLNIKVKKWEPIPIPPKPSALEAEIYNQVIDLSYNQAGVFEIMDIKIFEKVAKNNDMDNSVVNNIYRKVLLWQKSQ